MEKEYSTEKLLDLLSEYMEEIKWRDVEITSVGWEKYEWEIRKFIVEYIDEYNDEEEKSYIWVGRLISKKFWFIKWLVENEKINNTALQEYWDRWEMWMWVFSNMYNSDIVILTLSIQDEPIEFLVSILK